MLVNASIMVSLMDASMFVAVCLCRRGNCLLAPSTTNFELELLAVELED